MVSLCTTFTLKEVYYILIKSITTLNNLKFKLEIRVILFENCMIWEFYQMHYLSTQLLLHQLLLK